MNIRLDRGPFPKIAKVSQHVRICAPFAHAGLQGRASGAADVAGAVGRAGEVKHAVEVAARLHELARRVWEGRDGPDRAHGRRVEFVDAAKGGGRIRIDSVEHGVIADVLRRMVNEGLPVIEFHKEERRLEDAFIDLLGKLEEAEAAELAGSLSPVAPSPEPSTDPAA